MIFVNANGFAVELKESAVKDVVRALKAHDIEPSDNLRLMVTEASKVKVELLYQDAHKKVRVVLSPKAIVGVLKEQPC